MCHGFSNFQLVPAPFAVLALFGLIFLEATAIGVILFGLVTRRALLAKVVFALAAAGAAVYLIALLGLSALSRERVLARGEEKYFCEVDCHLAYSVTGVETRRSLAGRAASGLYRIVTLHVRFDENTIAPWRPRDLPLTPNPRLVRVIDASARSFLPDADAQRALETIAGPQVPLTRALKPGDSYETNLVFDLPANAPNPRLLITTADSPTRLMLGHENSFLHGKTSFRL